MNEFKVIKTLERVKSILGGDHHSLANVRLDEDHCRQWWTLMENESVIFRDASIEGIYHYLLGRLSMEQEPSSSDWISADNFPKEDEVEVLGWGSLYGFQIVTCRNKSYFDCENDLVSAFVEYYRPLPEAPKP